MDYMLAKTESANAFAASTEDISELKCSVIISWRAAFIVFPWAIPWAKLGTSPPFAPAVLISALDVSMDEFDKCAKTSNADIKTAGASGGLVPSFAHGMAQGNTMKAALQDIITEHFNSDMSSVDAANALADSVLANM